MKEVPYMCPMCGAQLAYKKQDKTFFYFICHECGKKWLEMK